MKTIILSILACTLTFIATAQTATADNITYAAPTGWKKETRNDVILFSNTQDSNWCVLAIYKSKPGSDNIDIDFDKEWVAHVAARYQAIGQPQKGAVQQSGNRKTMTGSGSFTLDQQTATATLSTIIEQNNCISIVAISNSGQYSKEVEAFISSVRISKPATTK